MSTGMQPIPQHNSLLDGGWFISFLLPLFRKIQHPKLMARRSWFILHMHSTSLFVSDLIKCHLMSISNTILAFIPLLFLIFSNTSLSQHTSVIEIFWPNFDAIDYFTNSIPYKISHSPMKLWLGTILFGHSHRRIEIQFNSIDSVFQWTKKNLFWNLSFPS